MKKSNWINFVFNIWKLKAYVKSLVEGQYLKVNYENKSLNVRNRWLKIGMFGSWKSKVKKLKVKSYWNVFFFKYWKAESCFMIDIRIRIVQSKLGLWNFKQNQRILIFESISVSNQLKITLTKPIMWRTLWLFMISFLFFLLHPVRPLRRGVVQFRVVRDSWAWGAFSWLLIGSSDATNNALANNTTETHPPLFLSPPPSSHTLHSIYSSRCWGQKNNNCLCVFIAHSIIFFSE